MNAPRVAIDTGPILHFAKNSWLGPLKYLLRDHSVVIPEVVEGELKRKVDEVSELRALLPCDWIAVDRSDEIAFTMPFAKYSQRLVVGTKNVGECGVLALGKAYGYSLIVDDGGARELADEEGLHYRTTMGLLIEAMKEKRLTFPIVSDLADDLISGDYYLPFGSGGLKSWLYREGHFDYGELD